jgi:hypothetical protein
MLAHFAIGGAVVPSLRRLSTWELEDYGAFHGSSFQIFMLAIKNEKLSLMPGERRWNILGVCGRLLFVNCLVSRKD